MNKKLNWVTGLVTAAFLAGCVSVAQIPTILGRPGTPGVGLPDVTPGLQVEARRVKLSEPVSLHWRGTTIETSELVEFEVRTPFALPVASQAPVLRIGDHRIGYRVDLEPTLLLFTEFDPHAIPEGETVTLQMGPDLATQPPWVSSYVYHAANLPVVQRVRFVP